MSGLEADLWSPFCYAISYAYTERLGYVSLSSAEHRAEMTRAGESAWWEYAYASMFDSIREGRWAHVSRDVLELTGRLPLSLEDVLEPRRRFRPHRTGE